MTAANEPESHPPAPSGPSAPARSEGDALDAFFAGRPETRRMFELVRTAVDAAGPVTVKVTRSQIAFSRRRAFAWAWLPRRWLRKAAPLVVSVALARQDGSRRWKQVTALPNHRWMHHLELWSPSSIDSELAAWIQEAAEDAA